MCDADATLITYNWLKHHRNPHPNFNVAHKCRDYGRIIRAIEKYGINSSLIPDGGILRPDSGVRDFIDPPFDPIAEY